MHTHTYICITYIHKYMHTYIVYPSHTHTFAIFDSVAMHA